MTMRPQVLRSWDLLGESKPGYAPGTLPLSAGGTTYSMVQELTWLDAEHFAVGRWDGSMSVFQFTTSAQQGPVITEAVNAPSAEGVQMITWLAPQVFATSNDESTVLIWKTASGNWNDIAVLQTLTYDASLGVANSAASYVTPGNGQGALYLMIGHANGFLSIWQGNADGTNLTALNTVDLRAANPVNPWNLHNIRGCAMVHWDAQYGYMATGSEDGDICIVRIPDGVVMSRTVYNPAAQRGINSIAAFENQLLVANCAVGATDKNLWYYTIDTTTWAVTLNDATMLQVDPSLAQVFNFDVIWGWANGGVCWFASTEEGYLWMGAVDMGQLNVVGTSK